MKSEWQQNKEDVERITLKLKGKYFKKYINQEGENPIYEVNQRVSGNGENPSKELCPDAAMVEDQEIKGKEAGEEIPNASSPAHTRRPRKSLNSRAITLICHASTLVPPQGTINQSNSSR